MVSTPLKIMIDIRQSENYADYLSKIGWIVERIDGVNYFVKKFPLIGSIIKIQRPEKIDYKKINSLAKKYRAFQIILEPKDNKQKEEIKKNGFKLSNSPYLPTKNLELDLTKSEKELLRDVKKDCRLAIRKNSKSTIHDLQIKDIKKFRDAWKKAVGLKRYVPPLSHLIALKKSFGENCLMFHCYITVEHNQNKNAGAIFLKAGDKAYYWQAFTNSEGRRKQIQYKIVWEGILWAKKHGAKVFDFEGIYDERFSNKSWLGFTHFKKSFGGKEIEYPGCYTKFRFPL